MTAKTNRPGIRTKKLADGTYGWRYADETGWWNRTTATTAIGARVQATKFGQRMDDLFTDTSYTGDYDIAYKGRK